MLFGPFGDPCAGRQAAYQSGGGNGVIRRARIELGLAGARRSQFTVQPAQPFHVVNIVPRWQHVHVELHFARPFQGLRGNPLGAPADVLEQTAVYGLQSEQIITPIGGWAENGALSGLCQYLGGFNQQCGRQCRTVRIEDDRRGMSASQIFPAIVRSKQSPRLGRHASIKPMSGGRVSWKNASVPAGAKAT